MGKYSKQSKDDVAKEPYGGPDAIASAAGEGFIAHFQWAVLGLLGGGIFTWIFHKPVLEKVNQWRAFGSRLVETNNSFQRGLGKLINGIFGYGEGSEIAAEKMQHITDEHRHGFGRWLLNHTLGIFPGGKQFIERHMQDDRMTIAVTGGGLFAFFGYVILPWFLAGKGAERGIEGKRQFERAKDEIWDLRAENDQLRQRNAELKAQRRDNDDDTLSVSKDDPVVQESSALSEASHHPTEKPQTETVLRESPTTVSEPKIEPAPPAAPPVEKPHAAKVERPKADLEWAESVQQKADAPQETALA